MLFRSPVLLLSAPSGASLQRPLHPASSSGGCCCPLLAEAAGDRSFSKALREGVHRTVDNDQRATRSLHKQVSANLKKLDTQEQNLLDLAADGLVPRATIQKRISSITEQRAIMTAQLEDVERKLADVLDCIDAALSLLERPGEVYADASDEIRRLMNQALFRRIYVEVDEVTEQNSTRRSTRSWPRTSRSNSKAPQIGRAHV